MFNRYCLNFLNGKKCPNKNCLYLHQLSENLSFHKVFFIDSKNSLPVFSHIGREIFLGLQKFSIEICELQYKNL